MAQKERSTRKSRSLILLCAKRMDDQIRHLVGHFTQFWPRRREFKRTNLEKVKCTEGYPEGDVEASN